MHFINDNWLSHLDMAQRCIHSLLSGPRGWLGPLLHHAREHLGWPSSPPALTTWSLESKRELVRHNVDYLALRDNIQLDRDHDEARLADPIQSWTQNGCLAGC